MTEAQKSVSTQVVTEPCRASYAALTKPKANDSGVLKFSVQVHVRKDDKITIEKCKAAIKEAFKGGVAKGYWPADTKLTALQVSFRDGDKELEAETKTDPIYKGIYFFNASSNNRPGIVDKEGQKILDAEEIYSGMFARFALNFYPYKAGGNKGIAAGLNHVQKVRDGEKLSGGGDAEGVFGRYEDNSAAADDLDDIAF